MPAKSHLVYLLYDRQDLLLYVGVTEDLAVSHRAHAQSHAWFADVWRSEVEPYDSLPTALARARALIRTRLPLHQTTRPIDTGQYDDWLTIRGAAQSLSVSVGRVRQWLGSGTLAAVDTPDGPRIHPDSLIALRRRHQPTAAAE